MIGQGPTVAIKVLGYFAWRFETRTDVEEAVGGNDDSNSRIGLASRTD